MAFESLTERLNGVFKKLRGNSLFLFTPISHLSYQTTENSSRYFKHFLKEFRNPLSHFHKMDTNSRYTYSIKTKRTADADDDSQSR